MRVSESLKNKIEDAVLLTREYRHEFITPEHLLKAILTSFAEDYPEAAEKLDIDSLRMMLDDYLFMLDKTNEEGDYLPQFSFLMKQFFDFFTQIVKSRQVKVVYIHDFFGFFFHQEKSQVSYMLKKSIKSSFEKFVALLFADTFDNKKEDVSIEIKKVGDDMDEYDEYNEENWRSLVQCLNTEWKKHNPLVGREPEIERTIQVLCRKDKNNVLHIGEPGVGKTALIYGLVERIERGQVPQKMHNSLVYRLDLGSLLAGSQYRGEFEKRLKSIMEALSKEPNSIVYIDEIHTIIGAGASSNDGLDAANMLKPYLEEGLVRFIGATTYDEYNRYLSNNKSFIRRFQQIDVKEPSIEEAIVILKKLKKHYEKYHNITYSKGVIEYAVETSNKYISNRALPDKAIDLIDEAASYVSIHASSAGKKASVTTEHINLILQKVCKINAKVLQTQDNEELFMLEERIKEHVYGQDLAVEKVVQAVQMAKAGLLEEDKPLANLLFVGPTGVGKTEIAKVLSSEFGIDLVRFDMSEYAEKHAVAKLIGSPAGYVGYEDGGLLTAAIRRTPNCVLLLDEIEKAHEDIYNILLQVMDYAKLTDNKGEKADFRNVILILTSNIGAQYAHQASVGFNAQVSAGEAMLSQVKKTFKPEFINRLTATVVFNDMDKHMATLILNKKIKELETKLASKNITLELSKEAKNFLLTKGFTKRYGAREIDRVIGNYVTPLLTHEILFGKLKKGGLALLAMEKEKLILSVQKKLKQSATQKENINYSPLLFS